MNAAFQLNTFSLHAVENFSADTPVNGLFDLSLELTLQSFDLCLVLGVHVVDHAL